MNFQPRASHLVSASREVTLESQLYDLIRLLQGYWTTGFGPYLYARKTRILERQYAPEQGTWHKKCPPCWLAVVLIEIHDAMFNRQVFGYSTAITEFLGLLE